MTFLFVSLSYTAECAIVTAFITFIPKFIESQFGIPASNASIYTGKRFFGECGRLCSFTFILLCSHIDLTESIKDVWEPIMRDSLQHVKSSKVKLHFELKMML